MQHLIGNLYDIISSLETGLYLIKYSYSLFFKTFIIIPYFPFTLLHISTNLEMENPLAKQQATLIDSTVVLFDKLLRIYVYTY